MVRKTPLAAGVVTALGMSLSGNADVIDFNGLQNGEVVNTQFPGVTISAENPNQPFDLAITFDSQATNTADPDLEGPTWSMGNLAPDTVLGNLLIVAENNGDGNNDGLIDSPDDEQFGGTLNFVFDVPIIEFGMDIVDKEGVTAEDGMLEFYLMDALVATVALADFATIGSQFYDASVAFGDNSANRLQPVTAAALGVTGFDQVSVVLGGSGAVDNITFTVPAPGAAVALLVGLIGPCRRRRTA